MDHIELWEPHPSNKVCLDRPIWPGQQFTVALYCWVREQQRNRQQAPNTVMEGITGTAGMEVTR